MCVGVQSSRVVCCLCVCHLASRYNSWIIHEYVSASEYEWFLFSRTFTGYFAFSFFSFLVFCAYQHMVLEALNPKMLKTNNSHKSQYGQKPKIQMFIATRRIVEINPKPFCSHVTEHRWAAAVSDEEKKLQIIPENRAVDYTIVDCQNRARIHMKRIRCKYDYILSTESRHTGMHPPSESYFSLTTPRGGIEFSEIICMNGNCNWELCAAESVRKLTAFLVFSSLSSTRSFIKSN